MISTCSKGVIVWIKLAKVWKEFKLIHWRKWFFSIKGGIVIGHAEYTAAYENISDYLTFSIKMISYNLNILFLGMVYLSAAIRQGTITCLSNPEIWCRGSAFSCYLHSNTKWLHANNLKAFVSGQLIWPADITSLEMKGIYIFIIFHIINQCIILYEHVAMTMTCEK